MDSAVPPLDIRRIYAAVIANIVGFAVGQGQQPHAWVVYSPLPPLFLLMLTGLYLFALPYAIKRRSARSIGGTSAAPGH